MFCSATPPPRNVKLCERSSSDADDESRLQRARRQSDGADGTCACVRLCVCVCALRTLLLPAQVPLKVPVLPVMLQSSCSESRVSRLRT